jgi:hypothetical protein
VVGSQLILWGHLKAVQVAGVGKHPHRLAMEKK